MTITRRSFVLLSLCASAQQIFGQQGIASRDIKPQAKPAPSGRPFNAHFIDVAQAAGLHAPVIYGGVESKKYILEANGCGCAFIDYDNDGWMDIFLLSGTRLEGNPPKRPIACIKIIATGLLLTLQRRPDFAPRVGPTVSVLATTTTTASMTSSAPISDKTDSTATTATARLPM